MPQVLVRHDELIANAVTAARGSLIKSKGEGDATLSVFRKATDAASAALDLAVSIREESWPGGIEPRVRIAIHTGEAHERDGDYFGPSVNRAARVRSLAAGGQTLLSQVAAELVRDSLPVETSLLDLGERVLRGMTRAERVFELAQRTGDFSEDEDSDSSSRPPVPEALSFSSGVFVGRGLELEHLSDLVKQSADGELRVVFLAGEPGIGKTRLSAEMAQRAFDGGAIVLYGRCDEEPLVPYQPFVEALRGWIKSLSPAARSRVEGSDYLAPLITELSSQARPVPVEDPEVSRYKFFEAVASALQRASETALLLFVLDDLHWADRPTLQLLQHITRTRPRCPILLLGTYRETDLSRTRPLAPMLADFRRERAFERVALGGLAEEEIHELLQTSGDPIGDAGRELARALSETTEGNPFFIEQIVGSLIDSGRLNLRDRRWILESKVEDLGIPEGVIEAIGRRLSRLSDQCNKALAAASVLGRNFEVEVLTRVLGSDPEEVLASIEEGLQVGLIRELPGKAQASCTFSHALVQQALYEELSLARKQRIHLAAAQSIEDSHPNLIDSYVTTLARHLREAGAAADPEKAIDFSVRAMEVTAQVFAFDDGIAHGEAALEMMEDHHEGGPRAARLHERLGDMHYVAGLEYQRSFSHYEESLERWAALNEDNKVARVHIKLGRGLATYPDVADIKKAFEHLLAAKQILGSHPDPKLDGPLSLGLAAASLWFADPGAALEHASRAIEIGREQASDAVWATGMTFEAWALSMMGLFDQSTRKHDQAWETADRLDNVLTAFAAAWGKCHGYERDPIEHSNLAVIEFEKPRQAQTIKTRESLRLTAAGALVWAGQVPRAREMLQGALASVYPGGPGIGYLTDSFAESERLSTDMIALRGGEERGMRWTLLGTLVYAFGPVQWANGNIAGARESFERAVTLCERGCIVEEFEARARLACLEALDGEASRAAEHVTRLDALQELGNDWRGFLGTSDLARALTVFARETADAAEALFVKAIDNYREFSLPFGEAEALFMWGRALAGSDPGRATEKFSSSLDLFTRFQAGQAWQDLVNAELGRLS